MKNINKIAIIIAWPRELDMYGQIISALENEIVLIVDDQKYSQKQRAGSSRNIIKILNEKKLKFELLSEVYKYKKYKELKTSKEKNSYTVLVRFIFNLKRLMNKVPGGKSKMGSYAAAALLLLKEEEENEKEIL